VPRTGEVVDLCPDCARRKALPARLIPGRRCPPGSPCHLLGHDATGHRVANLLARLGWSLEQAALIADAELACIRGFGPESIARIKSYRPDRGAQT